MCVDNHAVTCMVLVSGLGASTPNSYIWSLLFMCMVTLK